MSLTAGELVAAGQVPARKCAISAERTVFDALQLMDEESLRAVAVVDDSGRLLGMYTERDYMRSVARGAAHALETALGAVMRRRQPVSPERSLASCVVLMTENDRDYLPVVADGRLVGVVPYIDALRAIVEIMGHDLRRLRVRGPSPRSRLPG